MSSGNLGLRRNPSSMDGSPSSQILKPQPRRSVNLSLIPPSPSNSSSASPHEQSPTEHSPTSQSPEFMDIRSNHNISVGGKAAVNYQNGDLDAQEGSTPRRSRSLLNLTGSTLYGIYSPTSYEPHRDEPMTPWGTGAQTPSRSTGTDARKGFPLFTAEAFKEKAAIGKERRQERRKSMHQQRQSWRRSATASQIATTFLRVVLLFAFGLAYGEVITQLHNSGRVAPVQVNQIDRSSWSYLAFWGLTGVLLGESLPYLDTFWKNRSSSDSAIEDDDMSSEQEGPSASQDAPVIQQEEQSRPETDWNDIVRSIGAFVGIAFAIRKLSWQSTLQVSLTLAMVNPVIWYLIDRTPTGFGLSSVFGIIGASILLGVNPSWVPPPATASPTAQAASVMGGTLQDANTSSFDDMQMQKDLLAGIISYERIGVATWVSSVLFCSSIFFGNIGRRLLPENW